MPSSFARYCGRVRETPERTEASAAEWPSYLLNTLGRTSRLALDAALEPENLSTRAVFVLACVDECNRASQHEVAERVCMDRSDLVKLLDRMEADGLLTRERDVADRRRQVPVLTRHGKNLLRRARVIVRDVHKQVLWNLSVEEREALVTLLVKAAGEQTWLSRAAS